MADSLYQHVVISGGPGRFITVFDEDPTTHKIWRSYNEALLYTIHVLAQSRI